MNKILSIELFTGAIRQKWFSETLFQIFILFFFEYSNIITNYSKMGLEIKKWKFDMKPRGPQSSFDRILLKVFEFGQKKANKNVQSADINFPLLPPKLLMKFWRIFKKYHFMKSSKMLRFDKNCNFLLWLGFRELSIRKEKIDFNSIREVSIRLYRIFTSFRIKKLIRFLFTSLSSK